MTTSSSPQFGEELRITFMDAIHSWTDGGCESYRRDLESIRTMYEERTNCIGEFERKHPKPTLSSTQVKHEYCFCGNPFTGRDPTMVACEECNCWYHLDCLRQSRRYIASIKAYVCPLCHGRSNKPELFVPRIILGGGKTDGGHISANESTIVMPGSRVTRMHASVSKNEQEGRISETCSSPDFDNLLPCGHSTPIKGCTDDELANYSGHNTSIENPSAVNLSKSLSTSSGSSPPSNSLHGSSNRNNSTEYLKTPDDLEEQFTFSVKFKKWGKYADLIGDENGYSKSLKAGWTDVFRKHFRRHNRYCPLSFEYKKINTGSKTNYFSATAHCKHDGCFTIRFCAQKMPKKGKDLVVSVDLHCVVKDSNPGNNDFYGNMNYRSQGIFHHEKGIFKAEFIRAEEREKLETRLLERKASSVATELLKKGSMELVKAGNITSMPARGTIRQIRYEAKKALDFASDPLLDICRRMDSELNEQDPPRYIQNISYNPFTVILFMDLQLSVLQELRGYTRSVIAHIDANGSLIRPILALAEGPIYVYSLVISYPMENKPALALLEFISKGHDADSISLAFDWFSKKARRYLKLTEEESIFSRIETDFSLALLGSVLQSYFHTNMANFLNRCWKILFESSPLYPLNLHVCRAHVSKAISDKVKKLYTDTTVIRVLRSFIAAYLQSTDFSSIVYRVRHVFTLSLSKYYSDDVRLASRAITLHTPENFVADNEHLWTRFDQSQASGSTLYKHTAFGMFFHHLKELTVVSNDPDDGEENPFYSKKFCKYLLRTVLPYTPLLTHIMFAANLDYRDEDHQAAVENWNKVIKIDEHGENGPEKIGRYVAESKEMILGRANEFKKHTFMFYEAKGGKHTKPRKHRRKKKIPAASNCRDESPTFVDPRSEHVQEVWRRRGQRVAFPHGSGAQLRDLPFVPWGRYATDKCKYAFKMTCTIDNTFTIFALMYQRHELFKSYVDENPDRPLLKTLKNVITKIESKKFNAAKKTWMQDIVGMQLQRDIENNLHEHEDVYSLNPLLPLFDHIREEVHCSLHGLLVDRPASILQYMHPSVAEIEAHINSPDLLPEEQIRCTIGRDCDGHVTRVIQVDENQIPGFVVFRLHAQGSIGRQPLETIKKSLTLFNKQYVLVGCSLYTPGHYVAALWLNNNWSTYDGTKTVIKEGVPEYSHISLCWYVRN